MAGASENREPNDPREGETRVQRSRTDDVRDALTFIEHREAVSLTPLSLQPGEKVDRFNVEGFLGRGGMGEVYAVYHPVLRQRYALKFLAPEIAGDAASRLRFEREAMVMAGLRHPGIVLVDDFGEWAGRVWLRMELVEGMVRPAPAALSEEVGANEEKTVYAPAQRFVALSQYLSATTGGLPEAEASRLLGRILEALAFAHGRGAIHRDLKPANILLTAEGEPKIADFGLVKLAGEEWIRSRYKTAVARSRVERDQTFLTAADGAEGAIMGTWEYMSPEQRAGRNVDARSDLYAMGLIAYRMLTGENLAGLAMPSEVVAGLSREWDAWIARALQPDPRGRFASADEMLAALPLRESSLPPVPPIPPDPTADDDDGEMGQEKPEEGGHHEGEGGGAGAGDPESSGKAVPKRRPILSLAALFVLALATAFGWWLHFSGPATGPREGEAWKSSLTGMAFQWIPPGTFRMGGHPDEGRLYPTEQPATMVTFEEGFWMGAKEVTRGQWARIMKEGGDTEDRHPVERVSWREAMDFAHRLTQAERAAGTLRDGWIYRLPTEAEWEYACRANSLFDPRRIDAVAWFRSNSSSPREVGLLEANAWGLFDMLGNVMEWCLDVFEPELPGGALVHAVTSGDPEARRVVRGGAWIMGVRGIRPSWRDGMHPDDQNDFTGFRLVLAREHTPE